MSHLMDDISKSISAEQLDGIANKLGASREHTQNAISMAIPTLLGAMARKADDDQGAKDLHQHLAGHAGGMAAGQNTLLNADAAGDSPLGSLLAGLLGQRQGRVETGIGKASGLSGAQVASLLAMLAPVVISALAKKSGSTLEGGVDFGSLTNILRDEKKSMENQASGGLLAGLLDQDGDGDFDFRDIMQIGMKRLFGSRK